MRAYSLGIMQPYFFPYLGYFSLIKHTDKWVVFDTVQYISKGWINRNRILKQGKDNVGYITVPVQKTNRNSIIKDVLIDDTQPWRDKIRGQLTYYKKIAPFYVDTISLIDEILEFKTNNISTLNVYILKKVCAYLGIEFNYLFFSNDNLGVEKVNAPDEWALEITKKIGLKTYINSPGGKDFFNVEKYQKEGIDLKFLSVKLEEYEMHINSFKPGLSIIDVLMFNSPEKINEMLDNYEFI